MKIISRAEAKAQGLKQYFTDVPCKHGHVDTRHVLNGKCRECTRIGWGSRRIKDGASRISERKTHVDFITRNEARASGLKKYFTGIPCVKGHIADRNVGSGACLECAAEWAINNLDKIKLTHLNSIKRCAAARVASSRKYQAGDKYREYQRGYRARKRAERQTEQRT